MKKNKQKIQTNKDEDVICRQFASHFEKIFRTKWKSDKEFLVTTRYDKRKFYRFKNRKGNPTLCTIISMCEAVGIHPKELFEINFKEEAVINNPRTSFENLKKYMQEQNKKKYAEKLLQQREQTSI